VPAQKGSAVGLTRFNLLQETGKRIYACILHADIFQKLTILLKRSKESKISIFIKCKE
jgi:hypothetical protein